MSPSLHGLAGLNFFLRQEKYLISFLNMSPKAARTLERIAVGQWSVPYQLYLNKMLIGQ